MKIKELNIDSSWVNSSSITIELNTSKDDTLCLQTDEDSCIAAEACMDNFVKEILKASEKEYIENKVKDTEKDKCIKTFEDNESALEKEFKKYGYE